MCSHVSCDNSYLKKNSLISDKNLRTSKNAEMPGIFEAQPIFTGSYKKRV